MSVTDEHCDSIELDRPNAPRDTEQPTQAGGQSVSHGPETEQPQAIDGDRSRAIEPAAGATTVQTTDHVQRSVHVTGEGHLILPTTINLTVNTTVHLLTQRFSEEQSFQLSPRDLRLSLAYGGFWVALRPDQRILETILHVEESGDYEAGRWEIKVLHYDPVRDSRA